MARDKLSLTQPRLRGHGLIWMGTTRAQCECGTDFKIEEDDCKGCLTAYLQDVLMDRHSDHIKSVQRMNKPCTRCF